MTETLSRVPQTEIELRLVPDRKGSYHHSERPRPTIVERSFLPVAFVTSSAVVILLIVQVAKTIGRWW